MEWVDSRGHGRVYSYTCIHRNHEPPFDGMVPYVFALVDLDEGIRCTANIVDTPLERVRIELPVSVVFESINEIRLPQFRGLDGS
jgi:uncharacterized OB-fold protein